MFKMKPQYLLVILICISLSSNCFGSENLEYKNKVRIPSGKHVAIHYNNETNQFKLVGEPESVIPIAKEAIEKCPDWLRSDLKENLSRLNKIDQEKYSGLILKMAKDENKKYLDEVAFCIAHISTEILQNKQFSPDILELNAKLIYKHASVLPYVEIVEQDNFTTLKYKLKEPLKDAPKAINEEEYKKFLHKFRQIENQKKNGKDYDKEEFEKLSKIMSQYSSDGVQYKLGADNHVVTVRRAHTTGPDNRKIVSYTLPKDKYYWYIVHPVCFTEIPKKIRGKFWREYFFEQATPTLSSLLSKTELAWDGIYQVGSFGPFRKESSTMEILALWANEMIPVNKHKGKRTAQPVDCLDGHGGSCTELQTVLTPAGRTALIPMASIRNSSENHQWNAFWLFDRWWPLQANLGKGGYMLGIPGNFQDRDFSGGKNISAISLVRGDGYIIDRTKDYTKYCNVNIEVVNKNGTPVESSLIKILTPYWPKIFYPEDEEDDTLSSIATYYYTDDAGKCQFVLGEGRDYIIYVHGVKNSEPFVIRNSIANNTYKHIFKIDSQKNTKVALPEGIPQLKSNKNIVINVKIDKQVQYGRISLPDFRKPEVQNKFAYTADGGHINLYVCDETNYTLFNNNKPFKAYQIEVNKNQINTNVKISNNCYIILQNTSEDIKKEASVSIKLQ